MTTIEAARELGVTDTRIRAMITAGRLAARRVGRDYHITPAALAKVRDRRPGRPRRK